jgi:hypothetical protein
MLKIVYDAATFYFCMHGYLKTSLNCDLEVSTGRLTNSNHVIGNPKNNNYIALTMFYFF